MKLTIPSGRTFSVTTEVDWTYGRVFYTVAKVGTFTIQRDPYGVVDLPRANSLVVYYGRFDTDLFPHYPHQALPEAPVMYGVTLAGYSVFSEERITGEKPSTYHGWRVERADVRMEAPTGCRKLAFELCRVIGQDYLARDDYPAVEQARARYLAPKRLRIHSQRIAELNGQLAALQAELTAELAGADVQAAMTGCAAVPAA